MLSKRRALSHANEAENSDAGVRLKLKGEGKLSATNRKRGEEKRIELEGDEKARGHVERTSQEISE